MWGESPTHKVIGKDLTQHKHMSAHGTKERYFNHQSSASIQRVLVAGASRIGLLIASSLHVQPISLGPIPQTYV